MKLLSLIPSVSVTNRLLAALPRQDYEKVSPHLELVSFAQGETIYSEGDPITDIYFPNTCVALRLNVLVDGTSIEVGMMGLEGVIGVAAVLGAGHAHNWTVVEVPGIAMRLRTSALKSLMSESYALQRLLMSYYQALITHITQRAVCHSRHTLQAQLCTWLLFLCDRAQSNRLPITHERISRYLGSRRAGITLAANNLRKAGFIEYKRGQLTILDGDALKAVACECYAVVSREFDQLMERQDASARAFNGSSIWRRMGK